MQNAFFIKNAWLCLVHQTVQSVTMSSSVHDNTTSTKTDVEIESNSGHLFYELVVDYLLT